MYLSSSRIMFSRELGSFAFQKKFSLATASGAVVLLFWSFGACSLVPAQLSGKWNLFVQWAAGSVTRPPAQKWPCKISPKAGIVATHRLCLVLTSYMICIFHRYLVPFPQSSEDLWNYLFPKEWSGTTWITMSWTVPKKSAQTRG